MDDTRHVGSSEASHRPGVDYDETYAAVSKETSWRMLLVLAAVRGWKVRQADVVTAFLYDPTRLKLTRPADEDDYLMAGTTAYKIEAHSTVTISVETPTGKPTISMVNCPRVCA